MKMVNRCNKCKIMEVTTCPLRDYAYNMFKWDGLENCAMGDTVDKLLLAVRVDGRFLSTKDGKRDKS